MGKTWGINPRLALWIYVLSNAVARTTVCISSLVAHGEQGRNKELATKPSG
jgi:hypothetical protein